MERLGQMAGRAGSVILDRTALVVHVSAMTRATGCLLGSIKGPFGNTVTIGAIASQGLRGCVVRVRRVAVGTGGCRTGGLVTDAAISAHLQQRIAVMNFRNRRRVAGLAGIARSLESTVAA